MIYWLIVFLLVFSVSVGVIAYWRISEQKYLKKPVRFALSPDLRVEIEKERESFAKRKARFEKAMERAQSRTRK